MDNFQNETYFKDPALIASSRTATQVPGVDANTVSGSFANNPIYNALLNGDTSYQVAFEEFLRDRSQTPNLWVENHGTNIHGDVNEFIRDWLDFLKDFINELTPLNEKHAVDPFAVPPPAVGSLTAVTPGIENAIKTNALAAFRQAFKDVLLMEDPDGPSGVVPNDWEGLTAASDDAQVDALMNEAFRTFGGLYTDTSTFDPATLFSKWGDFLTMTVTLQTATATALGNGAGLNSYESILRALTFGSLNPVTTNAQVQQKLQEFIDRYLNGPSMFLPSHEIDTFVTELRNVFMKEQRLELTDNEIQRRSVMLVIFEILRVILERLQETVSVQSRRLFYLGQLQSNYTQLINRVPIYRESPPELIGNIDNGATFETATYNVTFSTPLPATPGGTLVPGAFIRNVQNHNQSAIIQSYDPATGQATISNLKSNQGLPVAGSTWEYVIQTGKNSTTTVAFTTMTSIDYANPNAPQFNKIDEGVLGRGVARRTDGTWYYTDTDNIPSDMLRRIVGSTRIGDNSFNNGRDGEGGDIHLNPVTRAEIINGLRPVDASDYDEGPQAGYSALNAIATPGTDSRGNLSDEWLDRKGFAGISLREIFEYFTEEGEKAYQESLSQFQNPALAEQARQEQLDKMKVYVDDLPRQTQDLLTALGVPNAGNSERGDHILQHPYQNMRGIVYPGVWWFIEQPYDGTAKWVQGENYDPEDAEQASADKRNTEINPIRNQWIEQLRGFRGIAKDEAKQAQTNLTSTREGVNQQANLMSAIIQQLAGILQGIFR